MLKWSISYFRLHERPILHTLVYYEMNDKEWILGMNVKFNEASLCHLIRKIVREELDKKEHEQMHTHTYDFDMMDDFFISDITEEHDEPWAIFGHAKIDPIQEKRLKKELPKLLPNWKHQPFHPEFHELDAPPLLPPRPCR